VLGFIFVLAAQGAMAQPYPNKPVKIIITYPVGGLQTKLPESSQWG